MKSYPYKTENKNICFLQQHHSHEEDFFGGIGCNEEESHMVDSTEDAQIILKKLGYYKGDIDNLGSHGNTKTTDALQSFIKDWNKENPNDTIDIDIDGEGRPEYFTKEVLTRIQIVAVRKEINWELNHLKDKFKSLKKEKTITRK